VINQSRNDCGLRGMSVLAESGTALFNFDVNNAKIRLASQM